MYYPLFNRLMRHAWLHWFAVPARTRYQLYSSASRLWARIQREDSDSCPPLEGLWRHYASTFRFSCHIMGPRLIPVHLMDLLAEEWQDHRECMAEYAWEAQGEYEPRAYGELHPDQE